MAERARAAFSPLFWNEAAGCLYDVIAPEGPDGLFARTRFSP